MAKVNELRLCPNLSCLKELPDPLPEACPFCKTRIKRPESDMFGSPSYLFFQFQDALELAKNNAKHLVSEEKSVSKEETLKNTTRKLAKDLRKWIQQCPYQDTLACAEDALMYAQLLATSQLPEPQVRQFIALIKQTYQLTEALEKYLNAGGYLYDRTTDPTTTTGDGIQHQKQTSEPGSQ